MNDPYENLLDQAREGVARLGFGWQYEAGPPASYAELDACETALGQKLPEQFRTFLLLRNGVSIRIRDERSESPAWLTYEILATDEITDLNLRKRDTDGIAEDWRDAIGFAGWSFSADYCAFASVSGHQAVIDLVHDTLPGDSFTIIATCFDDFIACVLGALAQGLEPEYWLQNPLRNTQSS